MISVIGKYIVGKEVVHNNYGKGKVLDYNNGVVTVEHEDGIHKFGYPVGFYRNVKMLDLLLEDFQTARIVEFDSTEAIIEESYERILNKVRKIRLNWVYRGTDIELIRELGFNINEDRTKEEESEDIWTIKEGYDFDVWMPYIELK